MNTATRLNLAAGWYIAMTARELAGRPVPLTLFGRSLVAWRDADGRPVLMSRHCPHMGASLADGTLTGGVLQCPFHGWRFDRTGACVAIPGAARIPVAASRSTYPTVERYGYVWTWYGSVEPMFALPELPALDRGGYRCFRLADRTGATVRRILENTYDPDHLMVLHGLETQGAIRLRMLTDQADTADHGPPIPAEAWLGAELNWPGYAGWLGAVMRLLGTNGERFALKVDGWPSGQRISYHVDGVLRYRLLLATTPVAPNRTVQHIAVAVEPKGGFWKDLPRYLVSRAEITVASNQDLPIFNTIGPGDEHGIYLEGDHGVRRFRRFYQSWVDRVSTGRVDA